MTTLDRCYNIADLREAARRRLPKWIFEFVDRGAEDEIALAHNLEAFRRLKLRHRVMVPLAGRDLGTTLFGRNIALPAAIAPTGAAGLCWYEGELALAKAAAKFGVPFTMATGSTTPLEKVAAEAGGQLWFQLYIWENRQWSHDLVRRAHKAGYEALVVTADIGIGTNREYNYRNGYRNPFRPSYPTVRDILLKPGWLTRVLLRYLATTGMPKIANNPPAFQNMPGAALRTDDSTVTWDDVMRLRDVWPGKLLIKGIVRADDAVRAAESGADGIIVSNHGGRTLDSAVAPIDALPAIVAAVGERASVLLDSGIRRGSDMVKAYALGAKAVLLGRATLWGTTVAGQAGAERALSVLKREYDQTLAHVGCRNASELSRDVLASDAPLAGLRLDTPALAATPHPSPPPQGGREQDKQHPPRRGRVGVGVSHRHDVQGGEPTTMRANRTDLLAAAIFIATGLGFAAHAWFGLNVGRALRMGPGYFPLVLGLVLTGFGVVVAAQALRNEEQPGARIAWRGLILVTTAIVYFGLTIRGLGLVPALIGSILIAAYASPRMTLVIAGALAAGLTAFAVGTFKYAVRLPLDLLGPWITG
jgi:(S)-mandelate dehydrogenase